jgi:hypothetical protein
MKTLKILTLIIITGLGILISCSSDDDSTQIEIIDGTWNLTNVSGGIAGINIDYNSGDIIWIFDSQNQTLTVESKNSQNLNYQGLNSGIYNYSVFETGGNSYLKIDGTEFAMYILSDIHLILDQNETSAEGEGADGFLLRLEQ